VSERVVDEGENLHVYAGDLGLAPGSGYVVAGVIGSDVEVAFVDAYDGAGGEMFSWSQEFPDYYPEAIAVLDDPEAITVWIRITALDGGSGDEHVVRFAADGTLLENDSFVSMANSLLPPLRSGDGWVSIGSPSENGGVRFDFMDAGFASTMIVDDPAIAPEDERFPILARPTPSGFVVVMYINDDSTSLDVRSYDHEGAPLHAETVSISSQVQSPEFIDVEAAADGTLYLVTDVPLMGGGHVHDTRLHRLAF
jgi:hypothetical protein